MDATQTTPGHPFRSVVRIRLPSQRQACIVKDCMEVDEELQPHKVSKSFEVQGGDLVMHVEASDLRMLRVALSSYFDMVTVSIKTLLEFDR
jgi:EKC/KEOPS complex subunit PCC1/LAGE3